jgi:hypothetical protein
MMRSFALLPIFLAGTLLSGAAWSLADADASSALDDGTVLYLGKIGITGHQAILETLQAIKISLKQPQSNDPKLANMIVCRLEDIPGTDTKQYLTCATNRVLAKKRDIMETAEMAALSNTNGPTTRDGTGPSSPSCSSEACYENTVDILDQALNQNPGKYIHVQVNGAALHNILQKIPDPAPDAVTDIAPQAATQMAPAATTHQ